MIKKLIALILLCTVLWGCSAKAPKPAASKNREASMPTVGICLQGNSWNSQSATLQALLEEQGCRVLTEYAGDDLQLQQTQVETFVNMPVDALVITAVDPLALNECLAQAKSANIPVIAWDRLPLHTDALTGYVSVDSHAAGQQTARYIIETKQLSTATEPVTIEFFMDVPEDSNSLRFYEGLMELLQPYLNSGVLQCRSGRTGFEDTYIQGGAQTALDHCFDCITEYYEDALPDVLCAATDALAQGCIDALIALGEAPGESWPVITGVGGSAETRELLRQGYQTMSLHTDPDALSVECARWVLAAMAGTLPDGQTCDNGTAQVPSNLQIPVLMDAGSLPEEEN